ncbi:MAG TPA: flagellar basal body P-ring protein FlgI [Gemmataceae bacterium]|nr:flagellar basal body P-ring protein FlgI [Gemmataceae bacterium]
MKAIRRACRLPLSRRPLWVGAAVLLALAGCAKQNLRLQAEDDVGQAQYSVETIKEWAMFEGADPMQVFGVGLVTGLRGTGSAAPPGDERKVLEKELQQQGVINVKEVLSRTDVSMVVLSALIPPGAQKGDPLDVEVRLPPGSRTTSLEGGYLEPCELRNFAPMSMIAPTLAGGSPNQAVGHVLAKAEGKLLVGLNDVEDSARVKQARLWGGGKCKAPRQLYLFMNEQRRQAANTNLIAEKINDAFRSSLGGPLGDKVAEAKTGTVVVLNVPPQYRLNLPHFMRVVGLIPLRTNETAASKAADAGRGYRKRLDDEILDPAHAVTASLRLEALGEAGKPALKRGLHSDSVLVRFCCAESLAYEGDPTAAPELAKLVDEPALRAFCLTALASLDESASYQALTDLLNSPVPETRYGAFRALRALNKDDEAVQGELLGESFWLHRTAPGSRSLIHMSSSRRAEIVLFGDEAYLKPPLRLSAGEINVTADDSDTQCTVSRFSPRTRQKRSGYSSLKVEDVIHKVAELGGDYAAVTELLRQARRCDCVSCAVEVDALPQAADVYALKRAGQRAKAGAEDDEEVLSSRLNLGATPTLFEKDGARGLRASDATTPGDRLPNE